MTSFSIHKAKGKTRGHPPRWLIFRGMTTKAGQVAICSSYEEAVECRNNLYKLENLWVKFLTPPEM